MVRTLGIDIGSASSKAVIMEDGEKILGSSVFQFGTGSTGPSTVIKQVFEKTGLKKDDIAYTVATGYGRYNFDEADDQISEISCHAKGIRFLVPTARTLIDIGGQDAKAIRLDENGTVAQFLMNDKCAAGTGRFLEVMSRVLQLDITQLQEYDAKASEVVPVSSTCTVFAESELISHLSENLPKENIIAGIHAAVASKAGSLAMRVGVLDDVVMGGGVAQNAGVVRAMERYLKHKVIVAPNPQITGAVGAALFAYRKATR